MTKLSYATERKIRILEEKLGLDWKKIHSGRSVDAVYNEIMGDTRKNLFCKIRPNTKTKLDEMVDNYDVGMAELVEKLIEDEYGRFSTKSRKVSEDLAVECTTR